VIIQQVGGFLLVFLWLEFVSVALVQRVALYKYIFLPYFKLHNYIINNGYH